MVFEQYDEPNYVYDGTSDALASAYGSIQLDLDGSSQRTSNNKLTSSSASKFSNARLAEILIAEDTPYQQPAFLYNNWTALAEATLPLKTSALLTSKRSSYGAGHDANQNLPSNQSSSSASFEASLELCSRQLKRKLIRVNVISLLINLILAVVAFYFAYVNNSSSTSAFATDCVLDFISSAIVLWRYQGDLSCVLMEAREQIACIYLGALFEISALAIIIKATSDMSSVVIIEEVTSAGYDLVYLSVAATLAMTVLTFFKCSLYKTLRDKSLLLDVINTLISTIFAVSIIMSQLLINIDPTFWYLDPILSILLALFMAAFGLKVIHQNFNILRPANMGTAAAHTLAPWLQQKNQRDVTNYENNLISSVDFSRVNNNNNNNSNWQKTDHSSIAFV